MDFFARVKTDFSYYSTLEFFWTILRLGAIGLVFVRKNSCSFRKKLINFLLSITYIGNENFRSCQYLICQYKNCLAINAATEDL